jgi:hypothetical protein
MHNVRLVHGIQDIVSLIRMKKLASQQQIFQQNQPLLDWQIQTMTQRRIKVVNFHLPQWIVVIDLFKKLKKKIFFCVLLGKPPLVSTKL